MSLKTQKLDLFKYNTEADAKKTFKINEALNQNWDKIDDNFLASKYDSEKIYNKTDWVWDIVENEKLIFESSIDDNNGNPLTDETKWKKVVLGDGTGLPLGFIGQVIFPIDETKGLQRYLNGSNLAINTNTQGFLNKLKEAIALHPSLATSSLEEWETIKTTSLEGQCGKFYINEDEGYIRLPLVKKVQGCLNLANISDIVNAGLPNITGIFDVYTQLSETGSGAVRVYDLGSKQYHYPTGADGVFYKQVNFDASRSSDIYTNNYNNVQEEAIQYPYFIQIATGAQEEVNIINEVQLNNPFVLLEYKYFANAPYNSSWLAPNDQWNTKTLYPSAYQAVLIENNPDIEVGTTTTIDDWSYIKRGLSVKLSTDSDINDYDIVLNMANEAFKLPPKTHDANDNNSDLYLCFYVGETVQNANLINAGEISAALALKTDKVQAVHAVMPSAKYTILTTGADEAIYTAPADGWFCAWNDNTVWTELYNVTKNFGSTTGGTAGFAPRVYVPAQKGDVIRFHYSAGYQSTAHIRFIYANGTAPEEEGE